MRGMFGGRAFVALVFILLAAVPMIANPYFVYLSNLIIIYIMLAVGLNLLVGTTGQLAFANAAMWGIGAYTCGLLRLRLGVPFFLALPAGAVLAMLVGTAITLPALRLRGLYLASQRSRSPSRRAGPLSTGMLSPWVRAASTSRRSGSHRFR